MGTNGAGKSTLANAIMGNPLYTVDKGSIVFDGKDITEDAVNESCKSRHLYVIPKPNFRSWYYCRKLHPYCKIYNYR